jgi:NADPH-dependent 2,4-dienoyl-CoA reductase/sulfur reductase-like enzyme
VVVGASFGGITLALTVKRLLPDLEIVLVDKAPFFVFVPAVHHYLFGLRPIEEIARGYTPLGHQGLRVARSAVIALDRERKRVVAADGHLEYDYLVLAAGIRLAHEAVPGLAERPDVNLSPYDTGAVLIDLRHRIAAFRGGHVVVSTPNSPYTCPPAPYEYALFWAAHIKRRRLRARVTVVDPRSRPAPSALAPGLRQAMEAQKEVLTYEPFTRLLSVDPEGRTVETEGGRLRFDVLSVVPPNTAPRFIAETDLGSPFVEVDLRTFKSLRDERVYAVGDTAETPYAKTAQTAAASARIAGRYLARDLGAKVEEPGTPFNVCFPLVSADRALRVHTSWSFVRDDTGTLEVKTTGSAENAATVANARRRREWEAQLVRDMFEGSAS